MFQNNAKTQHRPTEMQVFFSDLIALTTYNLFQQKGANRLNLKASEPQNLKPKKNAIGHFHSADSLKHYPQKIIKLIFFSAKY